MSACFSLRPSSSLATSSPIAGPSLKQWPLPPVASVPTPQPETARTPPTPQVQPIQIPPPRGYVNDFAGVVDPAAVTRMEGVIADVREKTRGEIVVVTLADIGDRAASDVALQIGRDWKRRHASRRQRSRIGPIIPTLTG